MKKPSVTKKKARPTARAAADAAVSKAGGPKSGDLKSGDLKSGDWDLDRLVTELRDARLAWRKARGSARTAGGRALPSRSEIETIAEDLRSALFPLRLGPSEITVEGEDHYVGYTLNKALNALVHQIRLELAYAARAAGLEAPDVDAKARALVGAFAHRLPELRGTLDRDVEAAYDGDPAARSMDEVLLCYPGIVAVINHRLAHVLYGLGVPLVARIVSEIAHSATGIDIHPGAEIGPGFFIDHGTGVVIGETAVIGRNVRLYQGVTLGAKSFALDETGAVAKGGARHPILEDDVVVYAGATILGRVTIGRGSSIGGNVWLTRSVPPGSLITQANARRDKTAGERPALEGADE